MTLTYHVRIDDFDVDEQYVELTTVQAETISDAVQQVADRADELGLDLDESWVHYVLDRHRTQNNSTRKYVREKLFQNGHEENAATPGVVITPWPSLTPPEQLVAPTYHANAKDAVKAAFAQLRKIGVATKLNAPNARSRQDVPIPDDKPFVFIRLDDSKRLDTLKPDGQTCHLSLRVPGPKGDMHDLAIHDLSIKVAKRMREQGLIVDWDGETDRGLKIGVPTPEQVKTLQDKLDARALQSQVEHAQQQGITAAGAILDL